MGGSGSARQRTWRSGVANAIPTTEPTRWSLTRRVRLQGSESCAQCQVDGKAFCEVASTWLWISQDGSGHVEGSEKRKTRKALEPDSTFHNDERRRKVHLSARPSQASSFLSSPFAPGGE